MTQDDNIKKALLELDKVNPAGKDGFYYQGQEFKNMKCEEIPAFKGIDTLHKLYAVLRQSWKADTAYPSCQNEWVTRDPSYGQCAITASPMFLGWIMALDGVKILSPDSVVEKMKARVMQLSEVYLQT